MRLKIVEEELELGLQLLSELQELDEKNLYTLIKVKNSLKDLANVIDVISKEFPDFLPVYTFENKMIEINYKIHKKENDPYAMFEKTEFDKEFAILHSILDDKREILRTLKHNYNLDLSYVYAIGLPKFEYFDELSDFTKDLNFVLKTIVGREEKAKIVGFDVGSEWYLIGFDTYIAFKAFGLFVKESYKYIKRKKEDKERVKELKIENEQQKQLEEAMTVANRIFIQDGLNKLAKLKEGDFELTPEQMTQNLKAIEIFSGMLEKNMKVDIDKQPLGEDNPPISLPSYDKVRNLLESSSALLLDNSDTNEE